MTKPQKRSRSPFVAAIQEAAPRNKGGRPATGNTGRPIGFRLPNELLARLDAHRESHPLKPGRTAVVCLALEQYLDREQAAS
jgi:hypothetical protein